MPMPLQGPPPPGFGGRPHQGPPPGQGPVTRF
jgi:hypothetical protein